MLAAGGGKRWFFNTRDQTIQSWSTNGTPIATFLAFSPSANTTANDRQVAVTSQGEPILVGNAVGSLNLGGILLNPGSGQPMVWFGQWDADGTLMRARILATTTNATPNAGGHTVAVSAFDATSNGDVLTAGTYAMSLKWLGQAYSTPTNSIRFDGRPAGSFLAKVQQPARSPEIIQNPIANYTLDTGGTVKIGIRAGGAEPLTYQWRFNGVPIPGKDTNTIEFIDAKFSETGSYDVVVSNPFGQVVSEASSIIVRPPFNIRTHPASQLVLGNQELSGQSLIDLGALGINSGAIANKILQFVITNSTSPIFPVGGRFSLALSGIASGGSYRRPEGTLFPLAIGSYQTIFSLPDFTSLRFLRFRDTDSAAIDLLLGARFGIHLDIADPSGCCAQGTFSLSGGAPKATFRVTTTFVVPDGNFQWQHNGQDIPGQTTGILNLDNVTLNDAGTYRCVITYKGYTETSQPAELRVLGAPPVVDPPTLPLEAFSISANGMTLTTWPAGFVLQRSSSLSPVQWETIATTPPVSIPFSQPGEFFRLAPTL